MVRSTPLETYAICRVGDLSKMFLPFHDSAGDPFAPSGPLACIAAVPAT